MYILEVGIVEDYKVCFGHKYITKNFGANFFYKKLNTGFWPTYVLIKRNSDVRAGRRHADKKTF